MNFPMVSELAVLSLLTGELARPSSYFSARVQESVVSWTPLWFLCGPDRTRLAHRCVRDFLGETRVQKKLLERREFILSLAEGGSAMEQFLARVGKDICQSTINSTIKVSLPRGYFFGFSQTRKSMPVQVGDSRLSPNPAHDCSIAGSRSRPWIQPIDATDWPVHFDSGHAPEMELVRSLDNGFADFKMLCGWI